MLIAYARRRDIRAENIRMDHRPLTPGVTPHPQMPLHALDAAPVSEPLRRSEAPRIRYFFQGFARAETVGWEPQPPTVGTKHTERLEVDVTSGAKDEERSLRSSSRCRSSSLATVRVTCNIVSSVSSGCPFCL